MNILLIDCTKDKDGSYRHTVFKCSHINYKPYREVILDKWFTEIIGREYVTEFIQDPKAFLEKYT